MTERMWRGVPKVRVELVFLRASQINGRAYYKALLYLNLSLHP